jgi:hypothetical protein
MTLSTAGSLPTARSQWQRQNIVTRQPGEMPRRRRLETDPRLQTDLHMQHRFRRFGSPNGHQNGHQFSNP